ncbi:GroES-like protein [Microthyrium microscopicum]|uniref:GroES-like protein n=1 Tax=Microthyrium microscopicum TaxID=703497 RepID=A0A6A6U4A7_9PEZI|nr:GroES-like protein [Microthyrium microscopicum]
MPKEVIVSPDGSTKIVDSPIPTPGEHQVVIKVAVSGTNPKDWKVPKWGNNAHNSGDDIAGTIHAIGPKVYAFTKGQRVAAFHEMVTPHGSFAEYALAWDYTTFALPEHVSFEEAATIPLAAMTSAVGLFQDLQLPEPWSPDSPLQNKDVKIPLLVYGAGTATGAFAAQLGRLSGLKPIIGVAGKSQALGKELCDYVVDYREGEDATAKKIEEALKKEGLGSKVKYVFDGVSEGGSHDIITKVVDPKGGVISHLLPVEKYAKADFKYPDGVTAIVTSVGTVHKTRKDFGAVWFKFFSRALDDGRLKGHPYEIIPGGLEGVGKGLKNLEEGKASGVKYVYKISS